MTLIAIVALGAGVLIIVMLAIAFIVPTGDELIDKAERRTPSPPSAPSPRRQVTFRRSGPMPALRDATARATREARTTGAWKPAWPARRGITEALTAWRRKLYQYLLYLRARRRRGELDNAGWIAASVALSLALAYLIVHI